MSEISPPLNPQIPQSSAEAEATGVASAIARVAARLFAERGYEATSVREIVEAAGVAKPTLYYHFGSKEGLAHALLVAPQVRLVTDMRRILDQEGSPVTTLEALLDRVFDFCREDPDRARLMFAVFFGPLGAGLASRVKECGCEIDGFWEVAVARLAEAGLVEPGRAQALVTAVTGLHVIHILDFLYKNKPLESHLPGRLVADLLDGFRSARTRRRALAPLPEPDHAQTS